MTLAAAWEAAASSVLGGAWVWSAPGACAVLWLAMGVWVALWIDRRWGEPPPAWHPVVWMGNALAWCGRGLAPQVDGGRDLRSFTLGALMWCGLAGVAALLAAALQALVLWAVPTWLAGVVLGVLLKPLLAWRMLRDEVLAVEQALAQSLAQGRERLSWLVSRDTQALSDTQVRESAIETLAENLCDSVVAPLFWFVLLGLPGAALYRLANTADAMWGYPGVRGGRDWQWAGKWAARADDVLAWVPARITAALIALPAGHTAGPGRLWVEAARTPSPNGGWPMAAMALALRVQLRKPGIYTLNPEGRTPEPADTLRACAIGSRTVGVATLLACGALLGVLV